MSDIERGRVMEINYESGRIWHTDCPNNKWRSGVMRKVKDEVSEKRSIVECLHCGKKGHLPYGSIGRVIAEEVVYDEPEGKRANINAKEEG